METASKKEATMIYIKIDNDLFYDDAVVLVRSFYPRTQVTALKADTETGSDDEVLSIEVPDITGLDKKNAHEVLSFSPVLPSLYFQCAAIPYSAILCIS